MEDLFNKLENKEELINWIDLYAGFGESNYSRPIATLDFLMRFWDENKQTLFKLLDNNIILEREIKYDRNETDLYAEMRSTLLHEDCANFLTEYKQWVNNWYFETYTNEKTDLWLTRSRLLDFVNSNYLVTNVYYGESFKIDVNNSTIAIPKGCKITKILGKIAKAANLKEYESFRIAHSRVLNKKTISGMLCLSIHPLDYFTMSDNEYDWDSCMNWRDSGCYRMGTVEMCNSPYVIVAYLKGDKEMRFYNNSWNSKKWRNLFIVSKDIITGIKGYPYQSKELDTACINILRELAWKNLEWHYENEIYEHEFSGNYEDICFNNDREVSLSFDTFVMYNDFDNNNTTHFILRPNVKHINISYSGTTECMCCGEALDDCDMDDSQYVICSNCLSHCYCEECEERISSADYAYELDGITLCQSCYYNHLVIDAITDEEHHDSNCKQVFLIKDDSEDIASQDYNTFVQNHKCIQVYNDANEYVGYFKYPHRESLEVEGFWYNHHESVSYVFESECTDAGKEIFARCGKYL